MRIILYFRGMYEPTTVVFRARIDQQRLVDPVLNSQPYVYEYFKREHAGLINYMVFLRDTWDAFRLGLTLGEVFKDVSPDLLFTLGMG